MIKRSSYRFYGFRTPTELTPYQKNGLTLEGKEKKARLWFFSKRSQEQKAPTCERRLGGVIY
jgi:hypothetical protein